MARSVPLEVDVVRSPKRRKTVEARLIDGRSRLLIPARMSRKEEQHWVTTMRGRFERKAAAPEIDLTQRAHELAHRYDLPLPTSIRWVDNQGQRWGSCTPARGTIRISSRMAGYPGWVVDAVIVHELAHLVHADHGPAFKALMARYPLDERATGYLMAKSTDAGEEPEAFDGFGDPDDDPPAPDGPSGPLTLF